VSAQPDPAPPNLALPAGYELRALVDRDSDPARQALGGRVSVA